MIDALEELKEIARDLRIAADDAAEALIDLGKEVGRLRGEVERLEGEVTDERTARRHLAAELTRATFQTAQVAPVCPCGQPATTWRPTLMGATEPACAACAAALPDIYPSEAAC